MPRFRNPLPSYLPHKQSGRARAVWTDTTGGRHFRLLPGPFDSAESRAAFARLVLELDVAPTAAPPSPDGITVAELLLAFMEHADCHYRDPEGKPTSEVYHLRLVVRAVRELYADLPVAEFGPLALKAARQRWVRDGRSRTECNRRTSAVKRILKWGVSEELVPAAVYQAVATVTGLQRGRTEAPERPPVVPVEAAAVEATLPHLNRHVRGLVEFQRLTGCRPGEACRVRRCDLDMSGDVWVYRPVYHKGSWRGKARAVAVGPRAQALLREFFTPALDDYLFSPRRAVEEHNAARTAARKTKRWASHVAYNAARRKAKPKRGPKERYARVSYRQAVDRACDRAFPPTGDLSRLPKESARKWWARLSEEERGRVKAWRDAHRWHPNQLRHAHGTEVRRRYGLEAAQVALGHEHADVTQVYAEKNLELAARVAREIG
ncbi:tyrosine-type recombinase/integrase [bacterium]|nr:tyrosine-type recombinase/integrase [bacterium]